MAPDKSSPNPERETKCLEQKQEQVRAALQRLGAAGIDPMIPRRDCLVALDLSAPTISRMQRRNELPRFEEISPGRKGWRRPVLLEVLGGRRDWTRGR